jgi:tetratricopeptide (TPR) repeat protein
MDGHGGIKKDEEEQVLTPAACEEKGESYLDEDDYVEALFWYDRAAELAPLSAKGLFGRGYALRKLGKLVEALTSFDRALLLDPESIPVEANRGYVLRELGRLPEAVAAFDAAILENPGHIKAMTGRGMALVDLGRLEEARDQYLQALNLNMMNAFVWHQLGIVRQLLGEKEGASGCFQKAASLGYYREGAGNQIPI